MRREEPATNLIRIGSGGRTELARVVAVGILIAAAPPAPAEQPSATSGAVCESGWRSVGVPPGLGEGAGAAEPLGEVSAYATWDPDGAGPLGEQLIAGGGWSSGIGAHAANNVARWDGERWHSIGGGLPGHIPSPEGPVPIVHALLVWDADGDGPNPPRLVAGGAFATQSALPPHSDLNGIAMSDGVGWQPLGAGVSGGFPNTIVRALALWDPDGDGPSGELLFAGGTFLSAGSEESYYIAQWDGTSWTKLGEGLVFRAESSVNALLDWDPDGDGPAGRVLVAGGNFLVPGQSSTGSIATWDGVNWKLIGSGLSGAVHALTEWDPDGEGPEKSVLVAVGAFRFGLSGWPVAAQWNGLEWKPMGAGFHVNPGRAVTLWDPDGAGPLGKGLIIGGHEFVVSGSRLSRVARWKETEWESLGAGVGDVATGSGTSTSHVNALCVWPPPDQFPTPSRPGAGEAQLFAGGDFYAANAVMEGSSQVSNAVRGLARWDGTRWHGVGAGFDSTVVDLTAWDADGEGPEAPQLIACGPFSTGDGVAVDRIAQRVGAKWTPLETHFRDFEAFPVRSVTSWDSDGAGPARPVLIAAGDFTEIARTPANRVAMWDGSAWQSVGAGLSGSGASVTKVLSWNAPGASALELIAAGKFTSSGATALSNIARWNGAQWLPLGAGLSSPPTVVMEWDADADGPVAPALIAAGNFSMAGGAAANRIAKWDGIGWAPLGAGLTGMPLAIASWDPDGAGPQPVNIVVGGNIQSGGFQTGYIERWDGANWYLMDASAIGRVGFLGSFDFDGAGPRLPVLFAGPFSENRSTFHGLHYWTGSGFDVFDGGARGAVRVMLQDPADPNTLVFAGGFSETGDVLSGNLAYWKSCVLSVPACAGDMNGDATVDFDDLVVVLAHWGASYPFTLGAGDANLDGSVNMDDIANVVGNWLTVCE